MKYSLGLSNIRWQHKTHPGAYVLFKLFVFGTPFDHSIQDFYCLIDVPAESVKVMQQMRGSLDWWLSNLLPKFDKHDAGVPLDDA